MPIARPALAANYGDHVIGQPLAKLLNPPPIIFYDE